MCNPNTTSNIATRGVSEKPYFDFLSLPNCIKDFQNSKTNPEKQSQFVCPSLSEIITEAKSLFHLSFPIALTALILYSRSIFSMLFLGHLGDIQLAAGSLAIAFANITGYSVLSGLALGMEPLCSQAFGAQRPKLLSLTLHRSVIFLLFSSVPISLLWLNMSKILLYLHQDPDITRIAHTYLVFSLPDLFTNSFIHPIRIYLRAQGITHPLTIASLLGTILHLPINLILVSHLRLGVAGVAAASSASNFFVLIFLVSYLRVGVFGVVVVRDHDRTVWASSEPQGNGCINGCSDTNDVVDLRVPIVTRVRRVESGGERTRCESSRQGKGISNGIRVFGGCDGVFSNHVCIRDER
ncbi:unnamed protein product, partial [Vitis vinifera]